GSIWEGTGNIVALDALTRAVGRHGAESALGADLHARLDDSSSVPQAWRDKLHGLTDKAIDFAREVAKHSENEADARRATSTLYQVASAVAMTWEGARIHAARGDARRVLLARAVIDHRLTPNDPFKLMTTGAERKIVEHLLGDDAVGIVEAGDLVTAA